VIPPHESVATSLEPEPPIEEAPTSTPAESAGTPLSSPQGWLESLTARLNPHYVFLACLPLIIFWVNPNWIFQGFGHFDAWYYFGMSVNFPRYQHLELVYPGERLTWILPARLFVALLTPVYGWMAFHLVIFVASLFALYTLIRRVAGPQAALVTATMMGVHSMFIGANGWSNYDSGSMLYLILTLAVLGAAGAASRPRPYLVLAGFLWGCTCYTNLFWWTLTPGCALFYWGAAADNPLRTPDGKFDLRRCLPAILPFAAGLAVITMTMTILFHSIYGMEMRSFYHEQLSMVQWGTKLKTGQELSGDSSLRWMSTAGWVVFPILAAIAALIALVRHFLGHRLSRFALGTVLCYLYAFAVMVIFTFKAVQVLRYDYYADILVPLVFLLFGVLIYPLASTLSSRTVWWIVAAVVVIALAPMYQNDIYRPGHGNPVWWHYLAGVVAVAAAMLTRSKPLWIGSAIGIAIAMFGLVPQFTSEWMLYNYNGLAGTRRIADAMQYVDALTPTNMQAVFWFNDHDEQLFPYTPEFRSLMCTFISHWNSMRDYPKVDKKFKAGDRLVILTKDKNVFDTANAAMTAAGMPLQLVAQRVVGGEMIGFGSYVSYWLTFVEVLSAPPTASAPAQ
jgi:hypothetical protein